ncbi:arylsulfatase [Phyllobacterium sp. YR620]|uniref:arylsulfatase n=1 Tax=Phyllobacterium sp. YR620 TaxID=1881066 RepID=UPI00088CF34E|nr:arylsulfatase [Phyllobacterium sp. YR620]SDP54530.1 arylsulfatase [Phyllobacterium sp. YR620]
MKFKTLAGLRALSAALLVGCAFTTTHAWAQDAKPNILIIWGDDIGQFNISANNQGIMGYRTPNIDSIGQQGAIFTDWYGQQSCTAGRAAFLTGQSPIRTGLTKVGLPGAPEGLMKEDPTIAELLKPIGYATGQFGKNHVGDRNDMLPTVHGFDEWFGNLYHLNAEEEPENVDYPKNPTFKAQFGPRGVLHCFATDTDDPTVDPRFGRVGKQKCEDTGPLSRLRMETVDEEVTAGAIKFMDKAVNTDKKPFFVWWNSSRMHVFTHLKKESQGKTGLGTYADGMVEHDGQVGELLAELKKLGVEDNTIVMYSSDNGAEFFNWPDGGTTMFRGEKNTQWEGGFRVPTFIRWPGVIKPGTTVNKVGAHEDMIPTLLAAAGDSTVKEDLLNGRKIGDMTYKVHLDGYNLLPSLKDNEKDWPRHEFLYWTDGGSVAALRYDDWKISFLRQNSVGIKVWETPFEELRWPMLTNLRMDPFERASDESTGHPQWAAERMFALSPAAAYVAQWISSFQEFPPRQKPGSFSLDRVMDAMTSAGKGNN